MMESSFKEISIIPDYRALQIISENRAELESFISEESTILKAIGRDESFRKFGSTLKSVEQYLAAKPCTKLLNSEWAASTADKLRHKYSLTKSEIVTILNQLPLPESHLELMFPCKFSKEQLVELGKDLQIGSTESTSTAEQPMEFGIAIKTETD